MIFVSLSFLTDTQEAPKNLGLDSGSSTESLNEDTTRPDQSNMPSTSLTANSQQRSISPIGTVKSLTLNMPRPPLPFRRAPILSTGGAFTSYVRRRGEPDGGRTDTESIVGSATTTSSMSATVIANAIDTSSLVNTTDSELSDCYTSHTLNKFEPKPKMGYSSLRGPVKVGRPGGGGESDAAFTPSPPVAVTTNVSLALAHQTRIRHLYSATSATMPNDGTTRDGQMLHTARRPDSSSSASSTTDWESSGHATVLRRAHQAHHPPLPPPRQTLPLVDSLRPLAPLAPVYNNLGLSAKSLEGVAVSGGTGIDSSDSEFERGFDLPAHLSQMRGRSKLKPLQQFLSRKISDQIDFIDKLSVRTEITAAQMAVPSAQTNLTVSPRKPINLPEDETSVGFGASNLYFSPTENETAEPATTAMNKKELLKVASTSLATVSNSCGAPTKDHHKAVHHSKNIQESILRHMNREMTPTISDVYHERNLGLGLAPPLSKLLLSKNYEENDSKIGGCVAGVVPGSGFSAKVSNLAEIVSEIEINTVSNASPMAGSIDRLDRCNDCNETVILCSCQTTTSGGGTSTMVMSKKSSMIGGSSTSSTTTTGVLLTSSSSSSKPWLSNVVPNIIKSSDLTTADILERQNKTKVSSVNGDNCVAASTSSVLVKRAGSPFSELSRRDDGDGRSVADSQCSGSYKMDANTVQKQIRNKFNL